MGWSEELPSQEGFYWLKWGRGDREPWPVYVCRPYGDKLGVSVIGSENDKEFDDNPEEWIGYLWLPLQRPDEP